VVGRKIRKDNRKLITLRLFLIVQFNEAI